MLVTLIRVLHWVSWNLLLAIIPVVVAQAIVRVADNERLQRVRPLGFALLGVLGLIWLLFLPNTCYLLTEWRHLLERSEVNLLYTRWMALGDGDAKRLLLLYTTFYFVYSGVGMVAFTLAIRPLAALLRRRNRVAWPWGLLLFPLTSLGVYLGLILRFNSWDILGQAREIWYASLQAVTRPALISFILVFAGFLWVAYFLLDAMFDGLQMRWSRKTTSPKQ